MYLCSTSYEHAREISYEPVREQGLNPLDPELAVAWPGAVEPILSGKDARPVAGAGALRRASTASSYQVASPELVAW